MLSKSTYPHEDVRMLLLPIPLAVALVLAFLAARAALLREGPRLFPVLLGVAALQGVVISLVQHYGVRELLFLQPVTAASVPPLAYLAFRQAAVSAPRWPRDFAHLLTPLLLLPALLAGQSGSPLLPDAVLVIIFVGYGGAILVQAGSGTGLPLASLGQGALPSRIWQAVGAALILSAVSDAAIAYALHEGLAWLRPLIVSLVSSLALLSIGLLALVGGRPEREDASTAPDERHTTTTPRTTDPDDLEIVARLDTLMNEERVFLDPDLTLARLARRLGLPAKVLSAAVNRTTGENISRHVNARRIRHACELLGQGENVTAAMLASGFNTKSNFNREFLRVTGKTPSAFRSTCSEA